MIRKYLVFLFLFGIQVNAFAIDNDAQFEQIEDKQLNGRFWLPKTSGESSAVLLIGGSGGGYEDQDAEWLSSLGFAVLNVRYFGVQGLPEDLVNIPIEYFNTAIAWLNNHPRVKKNAIGIFGHSKGTEAAILTAYYNQTVKAVVLRAPSSVVWAGPGWSGLNESSWSWNGEPLDFHSVGIIDGAIWLSRIMRNKKMIQTRDMFANVLDESEAVNKAMLPVAKTKANLLFLSGKDDQQWPATKMADTLISVLEKSNFDYEYRHIAFDNAGHRPGRLSKVDDTFANGGTILGNSKAHEQTKILVKDFFDKHL